jgi:hypothetical protein
MPYSQFMQVILSFRRRNPDNAGALANGKRGLVEYGDPRRHDAKGAF